MQRLSRKNALQFTQKINLLFVLPHIYRTVTLFSAGQCWHHHLCKDWANKPTRAGNGMQIINVFMIRRCRDPCVLFRWHIQLFYRFAWLLASFQKTTATATETSEWKMKFQLPLCFQIVSENFARTGLLKM